MRGWCFHENNRLRTRRTRATRASGQEAEDGRDSQWHSKKVVPLSSKRVLARREAKCSPGNDSSIHVVANGVLQQVERRRSRKAGCTRGVYEDSNLFGARFQKVLFPSAHPCPLTNQRTGSCFRSTPIAIRESVQVRRGRLLSLRKSQSPETSFRSRIGGKLQICHGISLLLNKGRQQDLP